MIKSHMQYFDVLFPINLGPLTYICPDSLAEAVQPGLVVQAPLRNKLTMGIVLDRNISPPKGPLKELDLIPGDTSCLKQISSAASQVDVRLLHRSGRSGPEADHAGGIIF